MDDLISREAAISEVIQTVEQHKHEVFRGELLHYTGVKAIIEALPAVDAVPVVRCGECMHWQKPQIRTPDGMYRDYLPDEVDHLLGCPGVTADIGINVGGYCNGYWVGNYVEDGRHEWKGKDDYCSRGERRDDDAMLD